jgi:cell division inhibitor SepF
MGAMYRLKAYFGMVPAEELTEYEDEPVERYAHQSSTARRGRTVDDAWAERRPAERRSPDQRWDDQRWTDRGRGERTWDEDSWGDGRYADGGPGQDDTRADEPRRTDEWATRRTPVRAAAERRRTPAGAVSGSVSGPVRGALAIDTAVEDQLERSAPSEPIRPVVPVAAVSGPVAAPEQRDRVATLARITTLSPRSYKEARTIGERYRDGQPVIMNLTELDAADAKRLVDFAAGLAFALRGGFDKIATRVFLLTPADVEVSADDARKLAERGLFRQD